LIDYLGGISVAGAVMNKNDALLWSPNTGTNTSGFSALPGGFRRSDGSFDAISRSAFFWSATASLGNARFGGMESVHSNFNSNDISKSFGGSIRCLKD